MSNKKAFIFTLVIFFISSFTPGTVIAQPIVQEELRLSKLTLSAFECSLLAGDTKEAHRLLEVGFTAGRSFLNGISNLTKVERARLSGQADALWQQVWDGRSQSVVAKPPTDSLGQSLWGPTTDFILGRVFSERAAWANKVSGDASTAENTRSVNNTNMYRDRKCSLVHYHRSEHHSDAPTYYRSWQN
jgi:hypothetical protein